MFEVDPASLTNDLKDRRVTCARKMLSEYKDSDPRRLAEIINGDETWTRYDDPLTKERNMVWVVKEVEKHSWERRPKSGPQGMRLLDNNARRHKTKLVNSELDRIRVVELDHPPYSPDLAPCDFWLFAKLKKDLAGRDFDT
ncbi:Transposase [Oopsacas minuta]|uniref:Transposase n=1 Tax=Oopsacas minuta TaxID=111878 RepID=A0AAV7JSP6_9METZ|nr:Transposase [Oopsacas minuta]